MQIWAQNTGSRSEMQSLKRGLIVYFYLSHGSPGCPLEAVPFKVHVWKHLFEWEVGWGVGWRVSVSGDVAFSGEERLRECSRRFEDGDIQEPTWTNALAWIQLASLCHQTPKPLLESAAWLQAECTRGRGSCLKNSSPSSAAAAEVSVHVKYFNITISKIVFEYPWFGMSGG